ncbi:MULTISPECIES: arabinose ABC transporter substrate-binding protein [unclassified Luteibacter]|uniref:arabinose ABC transporter substrate-binding protein n=1 Tax=unclassified Luteibacter TaxID=2620188 RepID=UPI0008CD48FB|nr:MULTISPECIES: arabinose ABC transporter substrate-binding protein [unclassified Luteibacter]MDR6937251.1 L-arabinose transport system substrate-binding protein [Luteibacter sp. 3190]SEO42545.1 L-arabinose transport system substrate-binding protein [Luteibacter sp. UNC138MFCol5.1]SEW12316.1 L-arabinose-binding protein [Luteibacter sp. 329MFSha]
MKNKIATGLKVLALALTLSACSSGGNDQVKIGFVVKQPEEPWFQDEWKYAEQAAKEKGFTLVKIGAPDGGQVLTAIDNLKSQHAQGFIICTPDVKLGPSIVAKAKADGLKLMTVDDRLVDGSGNAIDTVPHMGISASKIGEQVGQAIADEMKKRGWNPEETGALRISYDQLPTAKERTDGAIAALTAAGFPTANIVNAPEAKTDTENAFNAANIAITQNPKYKHWVAFGLNDEAVLGAVRAAEGRGFRADNMIGVGIGGSNSALNEFAKGEPTGFFGSVLISPKRHGYETSVNMYEWIKNDKAPPQLTLTTGQLITKANSAEVRKEMGL